MDILLDVFLWHYPGKTCAIRIVELLVMKMLPNPSGSYMQVNALKFPTYLLQLGCVTLIKLFEVIISNNCCVATGLTCEELWVVCEDFDLSNSHESRTPFQFAGAQAHPCCGIYMVIKPSLLETRSLVLLTDHDLSAWPDKYKTSRNYNTSRAGHCNPELPHSAIECSYSSILNHEKERDRQRGRGVKHIYIHHQGSSCLNLRNLLGLSFSEALRLYICLVLFVLVFTAFFKLNGVNAAHSSVPIWIEHLVENISSSVLP